MAAATSSAQGAMKRARRENAGNVFPPRIPMNQGVYQDQPRLGPIQRALQGILNPVEPGPSPPVLQQPEEAPENGETSGEEEEEDEVAENEEDNDADNEEEEDDNLMQHMGKSAISPGVQLDKLIRWINIGFFLSTLEVLMDNAHENQETIRKEAKQKWHELLNSKNDGCVPGKDGFPLCGSPRMMHEMLLMSKHIEYIAELLVQFITDFDGSTVRLSKMRKATGFIKGVMVFDRTRKVPIYNNVSETIPGNFHKDLDNFKVNAVVFVEYLRTYEEGKHTPYPKCLSLLMPNE